MVQIVEIQCIINLTMYFYQKIKIPLDKDSVFICIHLHLYFLDGDITFHNLRVLPSSKFFLLLVKIPCKRSIILFL